MLGCFSFTCLLYALLGKFTILIWFPFLYIGSIQLVGNYRLGVRFSSSVIGEILHASESEISSFLTTYNIAGLIILFFFTLILCWWQHAVLKKHNRFHTASIGCLSLILFYFLLAFIPNNERISPPHRHKLHILPFPVQETIHVSKSGFDGSSQDVKLLMRVDNLISPAKAPSSSPVVKDNSGIVCILHIGESVSAERLVFNGYHRNTTPWLSKQKNLISFPRCVSLYHITTTAIIGLLSDGDRQEASRETFDLINPRLGNVADLFSKHGFYTAMLVGHNAIEQKRASTKYTFGEAMQSFTRNMNNLLESPGKPHLQAEQALALCREHEKQNCFLILNNEGSHGPFSCYDTEHPTFTPSDHTSFYSAPQGADEGMNNAFDNTLVYTDDYIRKLLEGLKGRPYIYIYISDHGEFLGNDGLYGRTWIFAHSTPEEGIRQYRQRHEALVGMFIIPSDEWIALHPHFAQVAGQLRKNRQMTICQGHLFDTLLGMFGIQTEHYQPQWDLSSPEVKPYSGTQPAP